MGLQLEFNLELSFQKLKNKNISEQEQKHEHIRPVPLVIFEGKSVYLILIKSEQLYCFNSFSH